MKKIKKVTAPAPAKKQVAPKTAAPKPAPVDDKTPKAEAPPKEPKAKKEKPPSKFLSEGLFTPPGANAPQRLRVSEYQDFTFAINGDKSRRLTDEELAVDWRKQFPHAVAFNAFHVKGARRDYNVGKHSKMFGGYKTGPEASVEYGPDHAPVSETAKEKTKAP
jgi:hypothetical protein